MTKWVQQYGGPNIWFGTMLLAVWALLVCGVPVEAQSPHYRIAVLTPGLAFQPALDGFREGLAQLGYADGKNITLIVEDTRGVMDGLADRAAKLVAAKPDLIFTIGTSSTTAAKQATTTVPIVFAFVADPLRSGLVASHASSQNNLTGISNHAGALSGMRLQLLQEVKPGIKRVLALVAMRENVAEMSFQDLAALAPKLGIELVRHDVTSKEDIEQVLNALPQGSVDAIFHVPSSLVGAQIDLLIKKGKEAGLPMAAHESSAVERGALMSYGTDFRLLGLQGATLVVKIMRGAKPSEIPIQTPVSLLLAINMTTARAINVEIPRSVLERTDLVVE